MSLSGLGDKDTCTMKGVLGEVLCGPTGVKMKCSSDLEILDPFEHVFDGLFWNFGLFYDGSFGVPRGG